MACRGGTGPALLLGPLAVAPDCRKRGIGAALMQRALAAARRRGHGAVLLVGDAPYYGRFGFSAEKTAALRMPGPFERDACWRSNSCRLRSMARAVCCAARQQAPMLAAAVSLPPPHNFCQNVVDAGVLLRGVYSVCRLTTDMTCASWRR